MKIKIKLILSYILLAFGILALFYPVVYWFLKPELTSMQILIHFWWMTIMGFFIFAAGIGFNDDLNKDL